MPEAPVPGLVSIMMPAYNAAAYIGAAIDSIRAQRYGHWELIVVDDGSTDTTAAIAGGYADPRVRCVAQANGGEAAARNRALQAARGEYLAFLDADDQFLPEHLAATVGYLRQHPARDGVYTDGFYLTEAGDDTLRLSAHRRGPFEGRLFEALVRASDVFGPPICVVLRRAVVVAHGFTFDPGIVIGPDWDFWTRVADVADFGFIAEPTCRYRVHQTNITRTVGTERRRQSLARCREKAIQHPAFGGCPLETREYALYDLLVNLLPGQPDRQTAVTGWPQFAALPDAARARLLRLMASQALAEGGAAGSVRGWLEQARALDPGNWRGRLTAGLYRLSPALCALVLRARKQVAARARPASPFGRLA